MTNLDAAHQEKGPVLFWPTVVAAALLCFAALATYSGPEVVGQESPETNRETSEIYIGWDDNEDDFSDRVYVVPGKSRTWTGNVESWSYAATSFDSNSTYTVMWPSSCDTIYVPVR